MNSGGIFEIGRNTHFVGEPTSCGKSGWVGLPSIGSAWGNQEWEEIPREMSGVKVKRREIKLGESMTYGEGRSSSPVFTLYFCKDMGKMVGNGFFADPEVTCNLAIALAHGNDL